MTAADWTPAPADIAATRDARRNGNLSSLLRQGIAEGRARAAATPAGQLPSSERRDINGITCPHCGAGPDQRCHLRKRNKNLPEAHQQRMALWARTVACCPRCQVTPTIPCHLDGMPLANEAVHAERYTEAERTAA